MYHLFTQHPESFMLDFSSNYNRNHHNRNSGRTTTDHIPPVRRNSLIVDIVNRINSLLPY